MKDKKLLKQEFKIRIYRYVLRREKKFLNFSFVFFPDRSRGLPLA